MSVSRREVLNASVALPFLSTKAPAATAITISVDTVQTLGTIPPGYIGLGYEISSVSMPGLLAATNGPYVQLTKNLGRSGVIRIGGNTSDFATYSANGTAVSSPKGSVITEANLVELRSFLDAIGWRLIWGLNAGSGGIENAVDEARAVVRIFGDRLIAFQVGNEPDLFGRGAGHRPASYGYDAWLNDYRHFKSAVRRAVPGSLFAGPDLAGSADWMTRFARDEGGDVALLSAHHYVTGQANPAATGDFLLAEEKKFVGSLATFREAARSVNKPWRMTETNSFYGGGKEGVSDTFAAALWVLDYLFVLMNYGCAGINIETGVNHLGKISFYSPIGDDGSGHYSGVKNGRGLALAVINKDASQDADAAIRVPGFARGRLMRLTAPALNAKTGVKLGGVSVAADGSWRGAKVEPVRVAGGGASVHVPAGSAALVWFS
jgi:hypothetical protein